MELPSRYTLDREAIKQNAYRLVCLFYANKEIARNTDPDDMNSGIAKLESRYFFSEFSKLLIEIAISLRLLDDQVKSLADGSEIKAAYMKSMDYVNSNLQCMLFDELSLREICNKIIHADVVEPHICEVEDGSHKIDSYNWLGWSDAVEHLDDTEIPKPEPIKWSHLTYNVRLGGTHKGAQWWHLLEVPTFVEAISELLE